MLKTRRILKPRIKRTLQLFFFDFRTNDYRSSRFHFKKRFSKSQIAIRTMIMIFSDKRYLIASYSHGPSQYYH